MIFENMITLLVRTILIALFLPFQALAQDLTGAWAGYLQIGDSKVPYELVIGGNDKKLTGYSLVVFTFDGVENVGIKTMEVKLKRGSIAIEDGELVYDNYTTPGRRVKLYGTLAWVGKDSNMTLAGTITTKSMDMRALSENSFKGIVRLQKQRRTIKTKLMSKLDEMGLLTELPPGQAVPSKEEKPSAADKTIKRAEQIVRTVTFQSDSLIMSLYDNGEVDGDTVSVLLDGKTILSRVGLSTKAAIVIIPTKELRDSSKLLMYAENLGRIPPNTGLLVLQDGRNRYQVLFSGDLQKNAALILRRKR